MHTYIHILICTHIHMHICIYAYIHIMYHDDRTRAGGLPCPKPGPLSQLSTCWGMICVS